MLSCQRNIYKYFSLLSQISVKELTPPQTGEWTHRHTQGTIELYGRFSTQDINKRGIGQIDL